MTRIFRAVLKLSTAGVVVAALVYGGLVATAWFRYGTVVPPRPDERDALLDTFMPVYEVVERHAIEVDAPASVTLGAARDADLEASPLVRAIIRTREIVLGAGPVDRRAPAGLIADMQAIGWGVLADVPDREVVAGAFTKPWEPNVTFHALPPDQFAAFAEPGYVKIAWTIRADPISATRSTFRTETRVVSTDDATRATFRRYWSVFSPGIVVIRWALLGPVKREAERRARMAARGDVSQPMSAETRAPLAYAAAVTSTPSPNISPPARHHRTFVTNAREAPTPNMASSASASDQPKRPSAVPGTK